MNEELNLEIYDTGDWLVAAYVGRLDLLVRERFCQQTSEALEARPEVGLVLDLFGVEAIDSSGLGAIFTLYKLLTARKAQLVLVAPNHEVAELLKLTHLDKVIRVEENLAAVTG
ncbi:MAG: STAS domain-containing protein [Deltaproteobacteria bacterium]|nr:STAS domain-containing protein [Deltaproteobacteria bacterium]